MTPAENEYQKRTGASTEEMREIARKRDLLVRILTKDYTNYVNQDGGGARSATKSEIWDLEKREQSLKEDLKEVYGTW